MSSGNIYEDKLSEEQKRGDMLEKDRLVWIGAALELTIIIVILSPKATESVKGTQVEICRCQGFTADRICFGMPSSCRLWSPKQVDEDNVSSEPGYDITLVIDSSFSMNATKLQSAKEAAGLLISGLSRFDRLAIIAFSNETRLVQDFTSNKAILKDRLKMIESGGSTKYLPALNKALFHNLGTPERELVTRKIVFLTDGVPEDKAGEDAIFSKVQAISDSDMCFYTIGFGNMSDKGFDILQKMAHISRTGTGCGRYYNSSEDTRALSDILSRIYQDTSNAEMSVRIVSPISKIYHESRLQLTVSTNIDAFCSYNLNGGNEVDLMTGNASISAPAGENLLKVTCRSFIGREQVKNSQMAFYVEKEAMLQGARKDIQVGNNLTGILSDIMNVEGLSIMSRSFQLSDSTKVVYAVRNDKPVILRNVKIRQFIPEDVAAEISSDYPYVLIQKKPLILEMQYTSLAPGAIASFSYMVEKKLTDTDLSRILTQVIYDPIDTADMLSLVEDAAAPIETKSIKGDGWAGLSVKIKPTSRLEKARVYMKIPKCMAERLNQLYFSRTDYMVISDDPLVVWNFADMDEEAGFEISGKDADDDCLKEFGILVYAAKQDDRASSDLQLFLLPLLIIPFIIILYILDKTFLEMNHETGSRISKLSMVILFAVFIISVCYPKDKTNAGDLCSCFGIDDGKACYGIPHSCEMQPTLRLSTSGSCKIENCTDIASNGSSNAEGADITLVIDRSKSMEGEKMMQAKIAAASLLSRLDPKDRLSIIQFDNSSQLLQQFSGDRDALTKTIDTIEPGGSTAYVPPLRTAYYNYLFNSRNSSRKHIIFVSDGAPQDSGKPASIFVGVEELISMGVCIDTIGFGQEITSGGEAVRILTEMASLSRNQLGCGSYYYSPSDMKSLTDNLGIAYEGGKTTDAPIKLTANMNSFDLTSEEALFLDVKGSVFGKEGCSVPMRVSLMSSEGVSHQLYYDEEQDRYLLGDVRFQPGSYNLWLDAEALLDKSCRLNATLPLGTMRVRQFAGWTACQAAACLDVSRYLNNDFSTKVVDAYITDQGFIPSNFSVKKDTLIRWTNTGSMNHSVTSGEYEPDGLFESGELVPGQSFNYTFTDGGPYFFFDSNSLNKGRTSFTSRYSEFTKGMVVEPGQSIDLVLVIDQSGSMAGSKIELVKDAARDLVSRMYPEDRISIIRFSDEAYYVSTFTDDRELLSKQIDQIGALGSTLYLPPLQKVDDLYTAQSSSRGKLVIFFSDGTPWDAAAPESIYAKVRELTAKGICVYTVGYGEEISPGSEGEMVLSNIVDISRKSGHCGRYVYSQEKMLSRIFGSIYQEGKNRIDDLDLVAHMSRNVIGRNETLTLSVKVKSTHNDNILPGFSEESSMCGPPAVVTAEFRDEQNQTAKKLVLPYVGDVNGYQAQVAGLKPGIYEVMFRAVAASDAGACAYEGKTSKHLAVLGESGIKIDYRFVGIMIVLIIAFCLFILAKILRHE